MSLEADPDLELRGGGRGEGVGGHASIVVTGRYKRGQIVRPYKCYKIKTRQIKVSKHSQNRSIVS